MSEIRMILLAATLAMTTHAGAKPQTDSDTPRDSERIREDTFFAPGVIITTKANGDTRRYSFGEEGLRADIELQEKELANFFEIGAPKDVIASAQDQLASLRETTARMSENQSEKVTYTDHAMCWHDINLMEATNDGFSYWAVFASVEQVQWVYGPGPLPPYVPVARLYAEAYARVGGSIYAFDSDTADVNEYADTRISAFVQLPYGTTCTTHAKARVQMLS